MRPDIPLRVSENGSVMLKADAEDKKYRAGGRNVNPANKETFLKDAAQAEIYPVPVARSLELLALRAKQAQSIREKTLRSYGEKGVSIVAKLEGRMAINLAEGLIENAGICLDRLFGLPYIPGSAVKGIARHAALWNIRNSTSDKKEEA